MFGSPYHPIAKRLSELLQLVRGQSSKYSLRNTFEFVDCIKDVKVGDNYMKSLYVDYHFSNATITEVICFLCMYLEDNGLNIGIPTPKLKELLLGSTLNVQFTFNGTIDIQKDGMTMALPLGPVFTDIFMVSLKNGPLKPMINNFFLY
ncbi:unnamed protein product [Trichobilharzia regenti]|nr:unnamed protein product [Trichobilharzia regenti]